MIADLGRMLGAVDPHVGVVDVGAGRWLVMDPAVTRRAFQRGWAMKFTASEPVLAGDPIEAHVSDVIARLRETVMARALRLPTSFGVVVTP